jgi:hypothetical protein
MAPPREGWEIMLAYIIVLTFTVILLFSVIRIYQSFRLHSAIKAKEKVPPVARTPHLHDLIFSKHGTGSLKDAHHDQDGHSL